MSLQRVGHALEQLTLSHLPMPPPESRILPLCQQELPSYSWHTDAPISNDQPPAAVGNFCASDLPFLSQHVGPGILARQIAPSPGGTEPAMPCRIQTTTAKGLPFRSGDAPVKCLRPEDSYSPTTFLQTKKIFIPCKCTHFLPVLADFSLPL